MVKAIRTGAMKFGTFWPRTRGMVFRKTNGDFLSHAVVLFLEKHLLGEELA
jgi:hypothetical protein